MTDADGAAAEPSSVSIVARPMPLQAERSVVEEGVRAGFGVAAILSELLVRVLTDPNGRRERSPTGRAAMDVVLGAGWGAARITGRVAGLTTRVMRPVVGVAIDPPFVPNRLRPTTGFDVVAARWRADRGELTLEAVQLSRNAVPAVVDSLATTLDLDLIIESIVDRLDLDRLVQHVLTRIDLDDAVAQAIDELDLTPILTEAIKRVELQSVVTEVIEKLDLGEVVTMAVQEIDLTTLVIDRVDLGDVVNSALDELDLTALVMERVDLVGIADYVVDAIDLPGIVRESTGSIASESIRSVRFQAVDADKTLSRLVDRFTLRGGRARRLDAPGEPESAIDNSEPGS